jgi:hypothetical protein
MKKTAETKMTDIWLHSDLLATESTSSSSRALVRMAERPGPPTDEGVHTQRVGYSG